MDFLNLLKSATIVSWKSTILGVLIFLSLFVTQLIYEFDADATTNLDWGVVGAAFGLLLKGMISKDPDKKTEDHAPARSRFKKP